MTAATSPRVEARAEPRRRSAVPRFLVATIGALALALAMALGWLALRPRAPLPVLGHVPAFQLVDERGNAFTAGSMMGHVTVVDFIFTHCTASCPRLTARMAELEDRLRARGDGHVQLLSFSVDPENDTPPVLAAYAARAHADPARWRFLTGPVDDVERAVVLGFKVSAAKIATGANDYEVTHGDWMVLVDRAGDIRGYYTTEQAHDVDVLLDDATRLARQAP